MSSLDNAFATLANSYVQSELIGLHFKEYAASSEEDKAAREKVRSIVQTVDLDTRTLFEGLNRDVLDLDWVFKRNGVRATAYVIHHKLVELAFFLIVGKYRDGSDKLPADFFRVPFTFVFDQWIYSDEFPNLRNLMQSMEIPQ
ncbi:MAG: hypothetical protein E6R03_13740 [Hyphomicrobiaceae bacterium]|nr:MAG: hypothetical protein E6R03_13740 [Hyphomicrobiaceae bacterium]